MPIDSMTSRARMAGLSGCQAGRPGGLSDASFRRIDWRIAKGLITLERQQVEQRSTGPNFMDQVHGGFLMCGS
jgi:hypothetical protein